MPSGQQVQDSVGMDGASNPDADSSDAIIFFCDDHSFSSGCVDQAGRYKVIYLQ